MIKKLNVMVYLAINKMDKYQLSGQILGVFVPFRDTLPATDT